MYYRVYEYYIIVMYLWKKYTIITQNLVSGMFLGAAKRQHFQL